MSYPTIDIGDKKIILLSGFEKARGDGKTLAITAKDQLKAAVTVMPWPSVTCGVRGFQLHNRRS
jgi:hypothetical protein